MPLKLLSDLSTPMMMGILLGGLYALIALGLSLVFGVMKLINVAHGDLVLFSSYFAYAAMTMLGIDPILSLVIGMPLLFVMGFAIQKYLLGRAFAISMEAPLIIAFGISLTLQNFQQIVWSPMSRGLTTSYALASFGVGCTRVPLVYLLDFIAALAGVFLGLTFPFTPQSGVSFLIIAFGVVIIGGLGSMLGTFIGGMVLGLAQTLGGYFLGAAAQMLFAYGIVLIVLAVRPQG